MDWKGREVGGGEKYVRGRTGEGRDGREWVERGGGGGYCRDKRENEG